MIGHLSAVWQFCHVIIAGPIGCHLPLNDHCPIQKPKKKKLSPTTTTNESPSSLPLSTYLTEVVMQCPSFCRLVLHRSVSGRFLVNTSTWTCSGCGGVNLYGNAECVNCGKPRPWSYICSSLCLMKADDLYSTIHKAHHVQFGWSIGIVGVQIWEAFHRDHIFRRNQHAIHSFSVLVNDV